MMEDIAAILVRLSKSKFRRNFILKKEDFNYIQKNGITRIELHADDFIFKRIAPVFPHNVIRE